MSKIGRLWTDSVAYVALILGAVTSIAGNVANVLRVRGDLTDGLDLFLAGFFPGLVVLMVEVFVSSRWRGLAWPMQILRWAGCAAVTVVAMRVSWVHLHALMVSRGQESDVAILGPLAIDFLAIMATALILAGRGQVVVQPVQAAPVDIDLDSTLAKWVSEAPVQEAPVVATVQPEPVQVDSTSVADEARSWLDSLQDAALDTSTTPAHPITTGTLATRVKVESIPAEATEMIRAWMAAAPEDRPLAGQADALVAAAHKVSTRTARGWRDALNKA